MNLNSLLQLQAEGVISSAPIVQRSPGLFTCENMERKDGSGSSWNSIARELAANHNGMFYVGKNGVSWVCGRGGVKARVVSTGHYQDMEPARKLIRRNFGAVDPLYTATSGGVCKLLLSFAVDPVPYQWESEEIYKETNNGYFQCVPGRYENLNQWDAVSFYFSLLQRLPNPRITLLGRGVHHELRFRDTERENWNKVMGWLADTPVLKHAFVGAMLGSARGGRAYCRGRGGEVKAVLTDRHAGPLRPAGILLVRSGYEICQAESLHSQSLYSIIDCVTLPPDRSPVVWSYLGIPYRLKFSGDAHIVGRGVYKIGEKETDLYRLKSPLIHTEETANPQPVPGFSYAANWLLEGRNLYGL